VRWKHDAGEDVPSDVARDGETVFATTAGDEVLALDLESGNVRWTFRSRGTISRGARLISSPSADDGRVFFSGRDGILYALDAGSGRPLWTFDLGTPAVTSPAAFAGSVYLGTGDGRMLRLDPATGDLLSEFVYPEPIFVEYRVEAGEQGIMAYVGRATRSAPSRIISLDLPLTSVRWEKESDGWSTPRALEWKGLVLAGDVHGTIYGIAPAEGEAAELVRIEGAPRGVSGNGNRLFVGTLAGPIYAYLKEGT
jgi:outer membrane protein assembly factor BamB